MENVVLTVHLILALLLIGVVLLQRSEGGGLGMGGGGGGGVMTGRQAANALSKATWILATAFLITSLTLTLLAARQTSMSSVIEQLGLGTELPAEAPAMPQLPDYTPPPGSPILPGAGQPITPPAPEAGTATPEAPAADAAAPAAQGTDNPATDNPATSDPASTEPVPATTGN